MKAAMQMKPASAKSFATSPARRFSPVVSASIRTELQTAGAVFGAPVAIAMLDVAGINIDRLWILALTQIDVNMLAGATGAQAAQSSPSDSRDRHTSARARGTALPGVLT